MYITFDQKIAEFLNSWTVDGWPVGNLLLCVIAILLSMLLCGILGFEREARGRSAGLRTHLLVGMGSCIVMIISIYGFPNRPDGTSTRDVARLAAQVISGVGFLGAGAIIYRSAGTKGLTTAGTIWISMAIGLACGSMNFILAVVATAIIMVVLIRFRGMESRITRMAPTLVVLAMPGEATLTKILALCEEHNCHASNLFVEKSEENGEPRIEVTFRAIGTKMGAFDADVFIEALKKQEGIIAVHPMERH